MDSENQAAIKKLASYDLILCGREASDWDAGQVGLGIAELLGLPSVTVARKVQVNGDKVTVELTPYDLTRGRITYRFK